MSFTEAFINPLPISPFLGSATLLGIPLWPAFFVTLIANLLGAIVGYLLGKWLGHPIAVKFFGKPKVDHAERFFAKWGALGVFLAALGPLPFKVAAWAAGIFELRFIWFFGSAAIGRAFIMLATLGLFSWGGQAFSFLVN